MASACPSTLGALKPILRSPSLLTAEARITAWTVQFWSRASASRLRTTVATPEPKIVPSPSLSKGRQRPSALRMPPSVYRYPVRLGRRTVLPPASAVSHSMASRARQAMCVATSDVEQAVCTVMAGPRSPSLQATRVARKSLSFDIRTSMGSMAAKEGWRMSRVSR